MLIKVEKGCLKKKKKKSKKHKIDLQELNIFKILAFVFALPVKLKCI